MHLVQYANHRTIRHESGGTVTNSNFYKWKQFTTQRTRTCRIDKMCEHTTQGILQQKQKITVGYIIV